MSKFDSLAVITSQELCALEELLVRKDIITRKEPDEAKKAIK